MEKNIKMRVLRAASAVAAVLTVVFGYWLLLYPNGYWQRRTREADKEEYSEKRLLWRKSETMTMQRLLQDMTLLADGDSVMVCWLTNIPLPVYRDFIHGTAQPRRLTWANTRHWYMASIANGRKWMQQMVEKQKYKSHVFWSTYLCDVQTDSTKDYHKEPPTPTEAIYDKMYPKFGTSTDKAFDEWRKQRKIRWVRI